MTSPVERCVVDNRVFLLGLDELYRTAMQHHERTELLACARVVTSALHIAPADVPIEGYYAEDRFLTDYFRLIRALQDTDGKRATEASRYPEFQRLIAVTSSRLYGEPAYEDKLLPRGRDALSRALLDAWPDWTLPRLTEAASKAAVEFDDFSLVGLAARFGDPVVLTALRESVVLYAEFVLGSAMLPPPRREFVWQVDDELARQAARFVNAYNALFKRDELPSPIERNAERYWGASRSVHILGRCVRLGQTNEPRYYHWAICRLPDGELTVHEFWHDQVWTTERYRAALKADGRCPGI